MHFSLHTDPHVFQGVTTSHEQRCQTRLLYITSLLLQDSSSLSRQSQTYVSGTCVKNNFTIKEIVFVILICVILMEMGAYILI